MSAHREARRTRCARCPLAGAGPRRAKDYMSTNGPTTIGSITPSFQITFSHRHFGKGNQCFADGHVEMIPPIDYDLPWWAGSDAYEYLDLFHNPSR